MDKEFSLSEQVEHLPIGKFDTKLRDFVLKAKKRLEVVQNECQKDIQRLDSMFGQIMLNHVLTGSPLEMSELAVQYANDSLYLTVVEPVARQLDDMSTSGRSAINRFQEAIVLLDDWFHYHTSTADYPGRAAEQRRWERRFEHLAKPVLDRRFGDDLVSEYKSMVDEVFSTFETMKAEYEAIRESELKSILDDTQTA